MRALGKVMDCIILSAVWLLFSVPVFTMGASTLGLYQAARKAIIKDEGYAFGTFWEAFKTNFKQSTKIWLVHLMAISIILIIVMPLFIFILPTGLGLIYSLILDRIYDRLVESQENQ